MASTKEMTLRIMACRQIYTGTNPRGDTYTIYEVDAQNTRGETINEKLRAFTSLPIGQEVEVEVTVFNSERHGKSFTLHPKNKRSSQEQVNEAHEEIVELRGRVEKLEAAVELLQSRQPTSQAADGSSGERSPTGAQSW